MLDRCGGCGAAAALGGGCGGGVAWCRGVDIFKVVVPVGPAVRGGVRNTGGVGANLISPVLAAATAAPRVGVCVCIKAEEVVPERSELPD